LPNTKQEANKTDRGVS